MTVDDDDELLDMVSQQQQMFEDAELFRIHNERKQAVKARQQAGEGFQPLPAGVHAGVIVGLVDLGKQPGNPALKIKDAYKLAVIVKFPGEVTEAGEPYTVTKTYTSSMFKLANLRKDIEGLFGKAFPSQEAADQFDFSGLLGRSGLFNVQHKASNGKVFANIVSIMPMPAGMEKPTADPSEYIVFDSAAIGTPGYAASYDRVPQWLRTRIDNQIREPSSDLGGGVDPGEVPEDDIPF